MTAVPHRAISLGRGRVTWYTWLEQGREIHASEQVLAAIGRVLLLDPHEHSHLFRLAGAAVPNRDTECQNMPGEVPTLLARLHPYPASVANGRFDLLAYNRAYQALVGDLDSLPFDQRNVLWLMFTSPALQHQMVDWAETVRRLVGQYRANMADHVAEPTWKCLVNRLHEASPEFARLWGNHDVTAPENLVKRMVHPDLGLLQMRYTNLWLGQRLSLRMVTYTPADEATRLAFEGIDDVTPRALP